MSFYLASIILTRKNKSPEFDDKIVIQHNLSCPNFFDVTFTTPGVKVARKFTADESKVIEFVGDILQGLWGDFDPFEELQFYTAIHPTFMYKVEDVDCAIRCNIRNMIQFALRADIKQKRISSE